MFHIKADIRAQRSAELLYRGLLTTLKSKPFNKVTVADISRASTVGRATFYRNFDEIGDLLYWKCDQKFAEVLTSYVNDPHALDQKDQLLRTVLTYWMNDSDLLQLIFSIGRSDYISNSFTNHANIIIDFLKDHSIPVPNKYLDYFLTIRINVLVGLIQTWLKRGKQESVEEVMTIFNEQHEDLVNGKYIF